MAIDVLVVGGGGREHALVSGLRRSPQLGRLFCAPGNAGIAQEAEILSMAAEDVHGLADFAAREGIALTIAGPEAPLVAGIADVFAARGLAVFGPTKEAAFLEGSKAFAKEIMSAAGVPTGEARAFTEPDAALAYLRERGAPVVVKADGLAAGKGVIVAQSLEEAEAALDACFRERRFGKAGERVLVEEFLEGEELSLLAMVSEESVLPLAPAQDYKRIFDGDRGPNTGGMGSYSPVPSVTEAVYEEVVETVIRPTVKELARRGIGFRGIVYAGLMFTERGVRVLEFNCRFGDPETQALIPRLESDLLELCYLAARGEALPERARWSSGPCVSVVMASRGYPESSSSGDEITGLKQAAAVPGVQVFHAGTAGREGSVVTAGGRVLAVSALGDSFMQARGRAYEAVQKISFEGAQFRRDIALRAEEREAAAGFAGGAA